MGSSMETMPGAKRLASHKKNGESYRNGKTTCGSAGKQTFLSFKDTYGSSYVGTAWHMQ